MGWNKVSKVSGGGGGSTTTDNVTNLSAVNGVNATEALDNLNTSVIAGVGGSLINIDADISTSIPFEFLPTVAASYSPAEAGDYRLILNLIVSMSSTSRSFQAELRLNGQPLPLVESPYISEEMKDTSDRRVMTFQRRLTLVSTDVVEFVFAPEWFGATAFIRSGSQFEVFKVDLQ